MYSFVEPTRLLNSTIILQPLVDVLLVKIRIDRLPKTCIVKLIHKQNY